jgi:hypothetical protein
MSDFWLTCGHHLLDRDASGGLVVTDDFLKAYLARPELVPPAEACDAERTLHAALFAAPRRAVASAELTALADRDAQENWRIALAFRDHLLAHRTLEAAYTDLFRSSRINVAPMFIQQLVHVILRNILDGESDPMLLRAAEIFFRPQRISLHEGSLLAADEETITSTTPNPVSPLVQMFGLDDPAASIDVMIDENKQSYWERSDRFDMAFDLTSGRAGIAALAQVVARWTRHLLGVEVTVEAVSELRDAAFEWYVGLDADATAIGDRLWRGETLDETTQGRVVGMFKLSFADRRVIDPRHAVGTVHLFLAMTPDRVLRMKPQNLITGLPIRPRERVA